ncbi:MAG: CHAT domain-containing protein [Bacteroidia bacterium]|nr:CHAT domain-containing protein [Bacteroidia bacterium]
MNRLLLLLALFLLFGENQALSYSNDLDSCWLIIKKAEQHFSYPRYDSALFFYSKALRLSLQSGLSLEASESALRSAECENICDHPLRALEFLRIGDSIIRRMGLSDSDLIARYEHQFGSAYEDLGDIETAESHYRHALRICKQLYGDDDVRTAYAYSAIAGVFSFRIEIDSAWHYANLARRICLSHPEKLHLIRFGDVLLRYAYEYKISKRRFVKPFYKIHTEVISAYEDVLKYVRRVYRGPSLEEVATLQGIANVFTDIGCNDYELDISIRHWACEVAMKGYKDVLAKKECLFGANSLSFATTLFTLAFLHQWWPWDHRNLVALKYYQKALVAVMPSFHPKDDFELPEVIDRERLFFVNYVLANRVTALYEIYNRTPNKRFIELIHENNRLRIRVWDRLIAEMDPRESAQMISIWDHAPFEEAVESAYKSFIISKDSAYLNEIYLITEKGRNIEFIKQYIASGKLSKISSRYHDNRIWAELVVPKERFQADYLDDRTAFIEYIGGAVAGVTDLYGLVLTRKQYHVLSLPGYESVDSLSRTLLSAMKQGDALTFDSAAHVLYQILVEPLRRVAGSDIDKLIISDGGKFTQIPFDALVSSRTKDVNPDFRRLDYLLKHYQISHALGATVLFVQDSIRTTTTSGIVGFAPEIDGYATLYFSKQLLKELERESPGAYYFDDKATLDAFKRSAGRYAILHIASHARADLDDPGLSEIQLANNNPIGLNDLYGMQLNCDLTVLATCESGAGRDDYGEGARSFARAFAYAGSRSIISTLWKVDDRASAAILRYFYDGLSNGDKKSEALTEAKRKYLKSARSSDGANPFYWAGYVLIGTDTPVFSDGQDVSYWLAGVILAMLALIVWKLRRIYFH